MKTLVTRTITLWILFVLTLALSAGFMLWTPSVGGLGLDSVATVADVQSVLASMSPAQRNSHFWMTLMLDMLFPFAYGGLFCGLTLKHAGSYGALLAIPALAVIPIDILENIIQMISLRGDTGLLGLKALLTPTKFFLFYVAALIAIGSLVHGIRFRFNRDKP